MTGSNKSHRNELRKANRKKTFLAGDIIVSNDEPPLYCLVKDLSKTGCLISTEEANNVPDCFLLNLSNGQEKYCSVIWRSGHKIGIEFM